MLLALESVSKRFGRGSRVALADVSLSVDAGEMVVVFGERQSGRTTLLRIAAGLEAPDSGVVRLEGRSLAEGNLGALGAEVGYCRCTFRQDRGRTVLEQLISSQLGRRVGQAEAHARALHALERVGAVRCAPLAARHLKVEEAVRVAIARALTSDPRLLVIDEPTIGVDSERRDDILGLLRSLADEGIGVLASTGDGLGLLGADRVVLLGKGRLSGELAPELAAVSDLARHRLTRDVGGQSVA
ncbi:MAG TPA: ATP-binding cassette domain-containing protein [Solirubrobacteraceae bacterium]|nr:ATP-binding cassette domain-containing protein [Solirubrobacteraceae bacterium]